MKLIPGLIVLWAIFPTCQAANGEPSLQEKFKKFIENPGSVITPYGRPRTVAKGAKPEIIIKGEQIFIAGKPVKIGDRLEVWKSAIPSNPRCDNNPPTILCAWDALGIEIFTKTNIDTTVISAYFYINLEPREPLLVTKWPDGTPAVDTKDLRPKNPFRGYFEIDGYGIDAKTEFWEILAKANPERNLHCGVLDCGFPLGALNDRDTIRFRLNKPSKKGNIFEISIGGPIETDAAKVVNGKARK